MDNFIVNFIVVCIRIFIVIKAERIPYDNVGTVYTFPAEDDNLTSYAGGSAQVMVPNGLLHSNGKLNHTYMHTYMHAYIHIS